jgi:hypothetical protein
MASGFVLTSFDVFTHIHLLANIRIYSLTIYNAVCTCKSRESRGLALAAATYPMSEPTTRPGDAHMT